MVKTARTGADILTAADLLNPSPLDIARQNADPDGIKKMERLVSLADRGITMLGQAADVLDRAGPIIDRITARQASPAAAHQPPAAGSQPCEVIRPETPPAALPAVQPPPAPPSINLDEVKGLLAFVVKRAPQTTITEIQQELPLPPPIAAGVAQLAQFQPDMTVSDMLLLLEENPEQIKRILSAFLASQGVQG